MLRYSISVQFLFRILDINISISPITLPGSVRCRSRRYRHARGSIVARRIVRTCPVPLSPPVQVWPVGWVRIVTP